MKELETKGQYGVIYTRYSSQSQDSQTTKVQLKACKEFANNNEIVIVNEFCDEAHTGRNFSRPEYQRMLRYIENNPKIKFVVIYKYDRFARNIMKQLQEENKLEQMGVTLLSTMEPYSNDANGKLMREMNYVLAEYYSNDYQQRIKKGLENVADNFQSTGCRMLGYKVKNKKYVINEKEAIIVREAFERYANGDSITDIIKDLNAKGYKTARKNQFNKNSLHRMLVNKRYIGIYTFKGKETPGKMPRIISDETFEKVQERMKKNKKAPGMAKAKNEYLLTTKLFCGKCKEMMVGSAGTSRTGKVFTYYTCKGLKDKKCDMKSISKEFIEDIVVDSTRKFLTDLNIEKIAKNVVKLFEEQQNKYVIKSLKRSITENNKKINNLVMTIAETDNKDIRASFVNKISELEKEIKVLEKELVKEEKKQLDITVDNIKYFLTDIRNGSIDTPQYRKSLINALVNRIYLYDDKMIVYINTQNNGVDIDMSTLLNCEEVLIWGGMLHQIDSYSNYLRVRFFI